MPILSRTLDEHVHRNHSWHKLRSCEANTLLDGMMFRRFSVRLKRGEMISHHTSQGECDFTSRGNSGNIAGKKKHPPNVARRKQLLRETINPRAALLARGRRKKIDAPFPLREASEWRVLVSPRRTATADKESLRDSRATTRWRPLWWRVRTTCVWPSLEPASSSSICFFHPRRPRTGYCRRCRRVRDDALVLHTNFIGMAR